MSDVLTLIDKHRSKGVLVDTNLLVLYLVGLVNKRRIQDFKRTQNFTVEDFDVLAGLIEQLGKLISTPHVLAQVSDLTDLAGKELAKVRSLYKEIVTPVEEYYDRSRDLMTDALFDRLGLTDTAICRVCGRGILVVTADVQLHVALERRGLDSLNFNHIRALGWS